MPLTTGASPTAHAETASAVVDAAATDLVALSHDIHSEPELAFQEVRSALKTQRLLAERGFEIATGQGGMDTAFRATYGHGPLVVGVCAEYDALPGIGHACGHNIIAASAVGTGLGLAEVADALGLTVVVIGTPAEEFGGGKALLLKAGAFDDVAAAVMLHPGPIDIAGARSLALTDVMVTYHGKESHAAVAPQLGINAADAVTVAQVSIGLLRQHLSPGQLIHGIVTEGGEAANIIPGRAAMQYTMRAVETASLRELEEKVYACFAAGAMATGCSHELVESSPPYLELTPDPWLVAVFREEMESFGRTPVPAEFEATVPLGSTDMGNVTQVLPGIHPVIGIDSGGAVIHQPDFEKAAKEPGADRAVVEGAKMLARTVIRLAEDEAERSRVLDRLARRTVQV
ncbi:Putative peptidase/amidohydrolase [Mycobacteroides abscessus subsp. bolletii]|uniref:M20 family metallopeptidase n=1 Tax=Mycobacteroides abscessus TaxID=36809 RepID=UPI0009A586A8|nr:M20 family metallopeptidase [Mycobacteroides abscessus]SKG47168.1 putative amidase AmiB1 [Mycobacteroides abscessus subsp. bolletii]SLE98039.1 Putative peptidase/amidohydrolase [Mycobacteroides abscessus subsp. bolletii]